MGKMGMSSKGKTDKVTSDDGMGMGSDGPTDDGMGMGGSSEDGMGAKGDKSDSDNGMGMGKRRLGRASLGKSRTNYRHIIRGQ